jgi:ankyrin repeat protein
MHSTNLMTTVLFFSAAGMNMNSDDEDGVGSPDDWWLSDRSSLDSSELDDMSICYPLDPIDAGICRKPALYGGRRSFKIEEEEVYKSQEDLHQEPTEDHQEEHSSKKNKFRSTFSKLTRFLSMEENIMTFSECLQKSLAVVSMHLANMAQATALHVVNQRLSAETEEQIECTLPYKCFTPLGYAVLQNDTGLVELLLKYNADTSVKPCVLNCEPNCVIREPETPLHLAALFAATPRVLLDLIEYSGSLREESMVVQTDLLKYCASCTCRLTVQRILDEINDVSMVCNEMDQTALHLAIECQNVIAVEELLKREADVNCRDRTSKTPLMVACYHKVHGNYEILKALLAHGADINMMDMFSRTPLHYAIRHCKAESVKLLVEAGADIRAKDCRGHTMIFYIFARQSKGFFRHKTKESLGKLLSLLIEASGGNFVLDYQQDFINTIAGLLESASTSEETIIKILESNTHHIKSKHCSHSQRVLHLAVRQQHMKVLEWFLKYGLDVHLQDADGWKAIHHAVTTGNQTLVDLLLSYGANIEDATVNIITPLWLMIRYDFPLMAEHFIHNGCKVDSSVKLKYLYHIPCESPRLPIELFDPDQQRLEPRLQARKAQRKITLLEFALHMEAYGVAGLILDRLLADSAEISVEAADDIVKNKLKQREANISDSKNTDSENADSDNIDSKRDSFDELVEVLQALHGKLANISQNSQPEKLANISQNSQPEKLLNVSQNSQPEKLVNVALNSQPEKLPNSSHSQTE